MRVQKSDVYFMMREVLKAAVDLLEGSDALSEELSYVETVRLRALQRSLEDLIAIRKAFDQDNPGA